MQVQKLIDRSDKVIPLIAALPYAISTDSEDTFEGEPGYNALEQRTIYAGRRDYSTSRSDDSAGGFFSTKSDTKKDD